MKKDYRNKILPEIKLKYFKRPNTGQPGFVGTHYICHNCRLVNIPFLGAIKDAYSDNPKYFCEDCAIDNYMIELGFKSREAAASWRRRMFDVGYLFQELLIDQYLLENSKTFEELSDEESDMLLEKYQSSYNKISKNKKAELEAIEDQAELEKELKKFLKKIKF